MIKIEPPSAEATVGILHARRPPMLEYYSPLRIPDEMLERTVELTEEYIHGRFRAGGYHRPQRRTVREDRRGGAVREAQRQDHRPGRDASQHHRGLCRRAGRLGQEDAPARRVLLRGSDRGG
jgi:hypothetical protein